MIKQKEHLQLLPLTEIEELYARPEFNDHERRLYFTLSETEFKIASTYETRKTRGYFILQLGYFKAKQQFFKFTFEDVNDDMVYIEKYLINNKTNVTSEISVDYIQKQRQQILTLFDYQTWSFSLKPVVKNHLSELIKTHPKIHNIFRHLLTYFEEGRIVLPSYRMLQDLFTEIVKLEKIRLRKCIDKLSEDDKFKLEKLIKNDGAITQLNVIRADQKNFKYTAIRLEVEKVNQLSTLYQTAKLFVPTLQLSNNAVCYYADITEQYAASRLRRLSKSQQFLHLICFIFYRCKQLNNNLITSFMYYIRLIGAEEKAYVEKAQSDYASKLTMVLPKVSEFLQWFPKQDKTPNMTYTELSKKAYKILPKEQFGPMAKFISGNSFNKKLAKQEFYSKISRKISLYLRPILLAINFDYYDKNHVIVKLIDLLKSHYAAGKPPSSLKITDELERLLSKKRTNDLKIDETDKKINPHLLESYVYQKMYHYIDRGQLCCNDSISYSDLKHDLVSDEIVDQVEEIAAKFGYSKIPIYCDEYLYQMINELDTAWDTTLENINSGKNKAIKIIPGHTSKLCLMSDANEVKDNNLYLSVDEKNKNPRLLYKTKKANGKTIHGIILNSELEQDSFSRIMDAVKQKDLTKISKNDKNKLLTITAKRSHTVADREDDWSLLYDASEKLNHQFFDPLQKIEITQLIKCIVDKTGMLKGFTHNKDRYVKRDKPTEIFLCAALLGEAFGISMEKMADMCGLNFHRLQAVHDDFFRVETLCESNDIVSNFIYSLPIFKFWNLYENKLLADADGQKHATSDSTIQSRFSKKYLGKGKGISLYTLIANFVPVNQKNIGLNEYEGHSLYDMVYGNKTDIDIDMVTGDNHSINRLNFMLLKPINVDYVPSIKNIREAANNLCSIKPPESYSGLIKPKRQINIGKIKSQKREILRVLLSLLLQKNTQSTIVRKLNTHSRYAELKAGLLEYNKIFHSMHVLKLIDDLRFRKSLRAARNRTESYHHAQSFIRKAYHGIFKGKKIIDNRTSAHATRLLVNCIIAYNSILLNAMYEKLLAMGAPEEALKRFGRTSPIAWSHFMFTGQFSFLNEPIDMDGLIKELEAQMATYFKADGS